MVNKQQLKQERKADISEEKKYLRNLYNNTKKEITQVNGYLNRLNRDIKIVRKLLEEVK